MKIEKFQMERTQCLYENQVRYNLSESGVSPLTLGELVPDRAERERLDGFALSYPESTGRDSLRKNIARFYGGTDLNGTLVVNGGSEANYIATWGLVGPGDRVAVMIPNYLQTRGLARAYGRQADSFNLVLKPGSGGGHAWQLDVESLKKAVSKKTKLIVVTNPNNPTGYVLTADEMQAVVDEARRVGAWILADEIYRGAELDGPMTPTFYGLYDKVVVTSGLSKAFALPGLRIGWIVSKPSMIRTLCEYHDYLTLTPSYLSDYLADIVMRPGRRDEILARTRKIINENLPILEDWLARHEDVFDYARPDAGAIATVRYRLPIGSVALMERFLHEKSVLITPGAHFGIGNYLRIGFGYNAAKLRQGLKTMAPIVTELRKSKAA